MEDAFKDGAMRVARRAEESNILLPPPPPPLPPGVAVEEYRGPPVRDAMGGKRGLVLLGRGAEGAEGVARARGR